MLVEVIFGYPGIGALLFQAIRENDYFLIQGIVFTVIVALGFATLRARRDLSAGSTRASPIGESVNARLSFRYLRRNASLAVGIVLLVAARAVHRRSATSLVDTEDARAAVGARLAAAVVGVSVRHRPPGPRPARRDGRRHAADAAIGFIAGFLGVGIGTVLAFIAAYYRGIDRHRDPRHRRYRPDRARPAGADHHRRLGRGSLTVNQMAIVVASLAWLNPTRTIRAQVLTLRERGYVEVARLTGMSGPEIIFRELMPNLLPYLAATLVNAVSAAILASIGLEVLGLGPIECADARHDALLGQLQRRHDQRLVVVVDRADRHHPDGVPRPVLPHRRARRDRQSRACGESA